MSTPRAAVLVKANQLIHGERQETYGPPEENFARIATIWTAILGIEIRPYEVALCMAGLKIARLAQGPAEDGWVDGCGYLALGHELAGIEE